MVTLSFTIFFGQKNHNRAHMLFQYLSGFEPILYTTHTNEEPKIMNHLEFSEEELLAIENILIEYYQVIN